MAAIATGIFLGIILQFDYYEHPKQRRPLLNITYPIYTGHSDFLTLHQYQFKWPGFYHGKIKSLVNAGLMHQLLFTLPCTMTEVICKEWKCMIFKDWHCRSTTATWLFHAFQAKPWKTLKRIFLNQLLKTVFSNFYLQYLFYLSPTAVQTVCCWKKSLP